LVHCPNLRHIGGDSKFRRAGTLQSDCALTQMKSGLLYGAIMAKTRNCGERQTWCTGGSSLRGDQ
jgi:hypothetical protein